MVWGQMVWHKVTWYWYKWGMVWVFHTMVLVQVGYGMGFPYHGIGTSGVWYGFSIPWYWYEWGMVWVFHSMVPWYWNGAYIPLQNGYAQGTLNQGIDVPHRYPKMGDWSDSVMKPWNIFNSEIQDLFSTINKYSGTISHVIHTEITWLIVSRQWATEVLWMDQSFKQFR